MITDEQAKAVGLRAVACPGWRWLKGTPLGPDGRHMVIEDARTEDGLALVNTYKEHTWWMEPDQVAGRGAYAEDGPAWPDFRSSAALGGLEALVGEAWSAAMRAADYVETSEVILSSRWEACRRVDWIVATDGGQLGALGAGPTKAEALVAALDAAPAAKAGAR